MIEILKNIILANFVSSTFILQSLQYKAIIELVKWSPMLPRKPYIYGGPKSPP